MPSGGAAVIKGAQHRLVIKMIVKTYAYLVRRRHLAPEVLVFRHRDFPEAGVQVPGGTVEAGETLETAVVREVFEESGLRDLRIVRYLGALEYYAAEREERQLRHFFELEAPLLLTESWIHTVTKGESDAGLVFLFEWWPLDRAIRELSGRQGELLR